jgi:voltage-gated potassium channel
MVRFLKLARYSPAMRSLLDALYIERRALFGCFVILIGATLFAAGIMHLAERHAQPDKFGTIPDAMWWAIVTLGTIGYGDVVPITLFGRMVASITIFIGLIMVALPIGIVATAFAEEIHRREFVVTWGMVARVPCDKIHGMRGFAVPCDEVEIGLKHKRIRIRLGAGHFFGEIAALRRARRSATVIAVTRTSLLALDARACTR